MAQHFDEQLSALVDGEIDEQELDTLLARLRNDPTLRQRWGRYHLISDAMRKNLPADLNHCVESRVAQALAAEPAILAPQRPSRQTDRPIWAKQAIGIAIAASVSAVAIFAFHTLHPPEAATNTTLANGPESAVTAETVTAENGITPESDLDPYLVNHNEHAVSAGMGGVLPYVRLVGYGESE